MNIICPIFYRDSADFWQELKEIEQSAADMIEIRLDRYLKDNADLDLISQLKKIDSEKELLFTIRTSKEGGEVKLNDTEYQSFIFQLMQLKGLVDIEYQRLKRFDEFPNMDQAVLSYHNFEKTPENLDEIWAGMEQYHPFIQKIAVMPLKKEDVMRLLLSCYNHKTRSKKIAVSMSELGQISRIIGPMFESSYSFAALYTSSAPGQVSIDNLVDILSKLALS